MSDALSRAHEQVGQEPTKDELATEAIRFLTSIANSVHNGLFKARAPALPACLPLPLLTTSQPYFAGRASD